MEHSKLPKYTYRTQHSNCLASLLSKAHPLFYGCRVASAGSALRCWIACIPFGTHVKRAIIKAIGRMVSAKPKKLRTLKAPSSCPPRGFYLGSRDTHCFGCSGGVGGRAINCRSQFLFADAQPLNGGMKIYPSTRTTSTAFHIT